MTVKDFERSYDHGYWANEKLFAVIAQLSPEEFRQEVDLLLYDAETRAVPMTW